MFGCGVTLSASDRVGGKVIGFILGQFVVAKDVKSITYCCYVRCTILLVKVGGMP